MARTSGATPRGTGPFTFAEWRSNEAVVVEANPDHWAGAPSLQAVVFRPITDANTRVAEMLAGRNRRHGPRCRPNALSEFEARATRSHEQAGPHLWFLILNAKEGPFADVRVRQAANYAVNKTGDRRERARRHRRGGGRADPAGLRLGA